MIIKRNCSTYAACAVCNAFRGFRYSQTGLRGGDDIVFLFSTGWFFFFFFFFTLYIANVERAVHIADACARTIARNPKCYSAGIIRPSIAAKLPFELIRRQHCRTTDAAIYLEIVTMPFSLNGVRSAPIVGIRPASNVHRWIIRPVINRGIVFPRSAPFSNRKIIITDLRIRCFFKVNFQPQTNCKQILYNDIFIAFPEGRYIKTRWKTLYACIRSDKKELIDMAIE